MPVLPDWVIETLQVVIIVVLALLAKRDRARPVSYRGSQTTSPSA